MKKILSLVLVLCLLCLSVSALADIPESVEDLPEIAKDVELEDFFGVWKAEYAVYDDEMASLDDAASIFGSLPVISIDGEKFTVTLGDEANEIPYTYEESDCAISVEDPDGGTYSLYIELTDVGVLKAWYYDMMLEFYMVRAEETPEA